MPLLFLRFRRLPGALASLALLALVSSCGDSPTQPRTEPAPVRMGQLGVYAQSSALPPSGTLVVQVSGPGIVKSDGATPDTLAFNIPLTNGVASGSITVPAGPQRTIMVRAFNGLSETHRGSVITDIAVGANPTVVVTLVPLVGDVTVTVSIGTTIVIVRPSLATLAVGDTLRMTAEIHDQNGALVSGQVRWATLNPLRATVDTLGLVTMRDTGDVQIVATYGTVGGASKLSGTPRSSAVAYELTWNGSVNRNWSEPNNWTPHGVGAARAPTALDSVVIAAGTPNQPWIDQCGDQSVRDLVVQVGATLGTYCGYGVNVYRGVTARGAIGARVFARPGVALAGGFTDLYVYGDTVRMVDSVRAGYLEVNNANSGLILNGHRLAVTNDLRVYNGTITMADGDTLEVSGNISWQGADETGRLDGGVLLFHGSDFYGYRYKARGTNRVVFDRAVAGQQSISGFDFINAPARAGLQRWDVRNRDGVRICAHLAINDTTSISSAGSDVLVDNASCGGYYVQSLGPVVTTANTNVAAYLWDLRHVTGTSLVAGGWSTGYTDVHVANTLLKPSLAYQNLRLFASTQASGRMTLSGSLVLDGASTEFALNGNRVAVAVNVDLQNNALLTMSNVADSLMVSGNINFNNDTRAAEATRITAGLLEVGGNFYGYGFNATGTNKVRMTSGTGANYVSGFNYLSYDHAFQELELAPSASIGNCAHTRVRGTLALGASAVLREQCGGYYLRVGGDLVTAAGSSVTPYLVELYNSTGTQNVNGAFAPQWTWIRTPLAPGQLKAGLGYTNMGIYAAVSLPGNLAVNGELVVRTPAASVTLNGHTLSVAGRLTVDDNATMSMLNPADSLVLNGPASFSGAGSHVGKLVAGTMVMRGDTFCAYNFYASGTHRTVFDRSGSPVRMDCVSGGTPQNTPFNDVDVKNYGLQLNCHLWATGTVHVFPGARVDANCGGGNMWAHGGLVSDAGSVLGGPSSGLGVVLDDSSGTSQVQGSFAPQWTYFTALHPRIRSNLTYRNVRIDRSTSLIDSVTFDGELDVINDGTILALNGHKLDVRGSMDFNNASLLRMDNAADTLRVGAGDETAHLYWDGADNTGLLTAGVVIFNGTRFYGQYYRATGTQKFVFTGSMAGSVSVEAAPIFRTMEVAGTRTVNLNDRATVRDTLRILQATQLSGTNYVVVGGGTGTLVTAPGSDITMPNVYIDGPDGTRRVQGRFRPVHTWLRNGSPASDALQPGLEYQNLHVEGPYQLVQPMTISGDISVEGSVGQLTMNNYRLSAAGNGDVSAGGVLRMQQAGDSLLVGGHVNLSSDAGVSTLSAGVIRVAGDYFYLQRAGSGASGTHKVVLAATGTGNQDVYTSGSSGQHDIRNLEIASTRTVRFVSNTQVTGALAVTTPTTVTANLLKVGGVLSSVPGSVLSMSGALELNDVSGTSQLLGGYRSTSITRFLAGASTIAVRNAATDSIGYRTVEVYGTGTVSGGALKVSGDLTLPIAPASLTAPAASSVAGNVTTYGYLAFAGAATIGGNADVYGYLTFGGATTGGTYLFVRAGATATTSGSGAPVDFTNIYNYSGGTLDNNGGTSTGGFRYKAGSTFYNAGTLFGPTPATW